jgi:hypothetical protein
LLSNYPRVFVQIETLYQGGIRLQLDSLSYEVLGATLAEEVFQDDRISGVGLESHIDEVAENRDQANHEVNDYIEHHLRLHTGGEVCFRGGADNHQRK